MRHRRVRNPEQHFAEQVDPAQLPGEPRTLREELAELGVPEHSIPQVEALIFTREIAAGAEAIRRIARSLGRTPAGKALELALLGQDGLSFEDHAREVGADRSNLAKAVGRVRARLLAA